MYLALYRKYRPQTFDDVISQEHITTTLKNQLKSGQTAHAYLFTGSRGTGKTTCAKILAKAINCLDPVDGNPCLKCESCRAIEEGATDVTEIDAASNTGVDNVRGLKEEAMYAPIACKKRIYIIDEVHMLSIQAFNALLKLIEEPPPHVVFIFATTEIHKVPATILSRCQRFEFRRIDINDSKRRLLEIAEKEHMELDEEAAYLISRVSDGGMRDALSLLDQCFSVSGHVTEEVVRSCAGISGTEHLFRIADAAAEYDAAAALNVLRELVERSKSPSRLVEELIAHYRVLMLMTAGAEIHTLRITDSEAKKYAAQNEKYTLEALLRALSILGETFTGMSRTRNEALACEMGLIRLCTPKLDTDETALSGRIDALEKLVRDSLRSGALASRENSQAFAETASVETEKHVTQETPQKAEKKVEMPIDLPFDIDLPVQTDSPESNAEPREISPTEAPREEFPPEPPSLSEALGLPPPLPPIPPEPAELLPEQPPKATPEPAAELAADGYEPFAQWSEVLGSLPFSVKILIGDTTALINGNTVLVCGSELQKGYAAGEFAETVADAVYGVIGRRVNITAQPKQAPKPSESAKKIKDFLDLARSQGVKIKEE